MRIITLKETVTKCDTSLNLCLFVFLRQDFLYVALDVLEHTL